MCAPSFSKHVFRFQTWDLKVDGNLEKQIEARGVLDPKILPYYPYRDDAVPLYKIIRKYVTNVVKYFYGTSGNICDRCFSTRIIFVADTPEKLAEDFEVQNWAKEMASPQSEGGCGIKSMPMKLDTIEQLVEICTTIVSTCSMGHAAANFQQYQAYGFPPNFPPTLRKMPPQAKVIITFLYLT
jgi:arachidonate 5-lipoxygenase